MTKKWTKYRRTNIAEMRPYVPGEDLTGISVSETDDPETDHGMSVVCGAGLLRSKF